MEGRPNSTSTALSANASNGEVVVHVVKTFAKRHKVITGSYVLGIVVLLLFTSGTKLTLDQQRQYNHIMNSIDIGAEYEASNNYAIAYNNYYATKGWFFSCDSLCQRNKRRMEQAQIELDNIRNEGYERMRAAKRVAGLTSELGIDEMKDSFWEYFTAGKKFAKRQSMWDMLFMGIRSMSRDETFVEYALRVLVQVLINFSMGLIMCLVMFILGLWSIIKSYQPDPFTALVVFVLASCAAFAFVSTYLLLIYGAAGGAVYGAAKLAETQLRLQAAQQGGQRPYIRQQQQQQNRPHYQ